MHEFHLILDRDRYNKLTNSGLFKENSNLSSTFKQIILSLTPFIQSEHDWGKQRESRYEKVNKKNEKRVHIHIYLLENQYRQLKAIHHDLNFYSIAQLIRYFLDIFLILLNRYKKNVFVKLRQISKELEAEAALNQLKSRKGIR